MTAHEGVTILLVEDDAVDVMAIERAFHDLKIVNPIVKARDGVEALDLLRGTNGRQRVARPVIVLLDLNLPRKSGIEFLEELRADPGLGRTVVFVLTTSADEDDRLRAYDQHVAGYVLKHKPGASFLEAIAMLQFYWQIVELPDD